MGRVSSAVRQDRLERIDKIRKIAAHRHGGVIAALGRELNMGRAEITRLQQYLREKTLLRPTEARAIDELYLTMFGPGEAPHKSAAEDTALAHRVDLLQAQLRDALAELRRVPRERVTIAMLFG